MNRRERRAQWLVRHRGEVAAAREVASPGATREAAPQPRTHTATRAPTGSHASAESRAFTRRGSVAPSSVRLHIEELILHGFDPRTRYAVGDAVQHELTRLLDERGLPSSIGKTDVAQQRGAETAVSFRAAPDARPQSLGTEVARALYGGLRR